MNLSPTKVVLDGLQRLPEADDAAMCGSGVLVLCTVVGGAEVLMSVGCRGVI